MLGNPIEAFLQMAQARERNRRQALLDAQGIGQNIGSLGQTFGSTVEALQKKRAQEQLINALQQPQQTPMQGPMLPVPDTGPNATGMQPRPMLPNPQADITGPLQQLYPGEFGKALINRLMPEPQKEGSFFTPEQAAFNVGDPSLAKDFKGLYNGRVPPAAVTARSQAETREGQSLSRKGIQDRFEETVDEKKDRRFKDVVTGQFNKLRSDPRIKDLNKMSDSMERVTNLLENSKGNTIAVKALGVMVPRALGEVGNLTATEQTNYITSGMLTRSMMDRIKKAATGELTDLTKDEIRAVTMMMSDINSKKRNELASSYVDNLARTYKRDPMEIAGMMTEDYAYVPPEERRKNKRMTESVVGGMNTPKVGGSFNGAKVLAVERVD